MIRGVSHESSIESLTDLGNRQGISDSFPFKLHQLITDMEQQGFAHVVSWQPHGNSFVVHKRPEFVNLVLPTFFRMSKYESFQRQLNLYGFRRMTTGHDKGGYYHESFVRDRLDLCFDIQRQKLKGTGGLRKLRIPKTESRIPETYSNLKYNKCHGTLPPVSIISETRTVSDKFASGRSKLDIDLNWATSGQRLEPSQAEAIVFPSGSGFRANALVSFWRGGSMTPPASDSSGHQINIATASALSSIDGFESSMAASRLHKAAQFDRVSINPHSAKPQCFNQPAVPDDMDSSFEALLSVLRNMDSHGDFHSLECCFTI